MYSSVYRLIKAGIYGGYESMSHQGRFLRAKIGLEWGICCCTTGKVVLQVWKICVSRLEEGLYEGCYIRLMNFLYSSGVMSYFSRNFLYRVLRLLKPDAIAISSIVHSSDEVANNFFA